MATLPPEIIEKILEQISSIEILSEKWDLVSRTFRRLIQRILSKRTIFDTTQKENTLFFNDLHSPGSSHESWALLRNLSQRQFIYVTHLQTDIATLRKIQSHSHECFQSLQSISVDTGRANEWANQSTTCSCYSFDELVNQCLFSSTRLVHIQLHIRLTSSRDCSSLCEVRELARCLNEKTTDYASWEVQFHDSTLEGQKWMSPVELCRAGDRSAVVYLRALDQLGIRITSLALIDDCKPSPYMLEGQKCKHRSLYMWNEFKKCQQLYIDYDIGLVATSFGAPPPLIKDSLSTVHLEQSHVLYIQEFLHYLSIGSDLDHLRVVAPISFPRRVSLCTRGCFRAPDYASFRPDGWAQVSQLLPQTEFILQNGVSVPAPPSCLLSIPTSSSPLSSLMLFSN
ncbi:unnamed protein product, partial [Mesorhabditis belari]|uniref:F-box domain-containing protein n=1 Tax=Mesorhabditis belari TaxID=2138241 RepID=A0AAF3EZH6_9BILA